MEGRIGITLLGVLNVATLILDLFMLGVMMYILALLDWGISPYHFEITIIIGIGLEILKWSTFYFILKGKKMKWLVFYGVYGGLMMVIFLSGFHYFLLFISSLLYFLSIGIIRYEHKRSGENGEMPSSVNGKSEELPIGTKSGFKEDSISFRVALCLFLLPILYLSYLTFIDWYYFAQDEGLFHTTFFIRMIIQTLAIVLSWFVFIHLWKNGKSNWNYLFLLPMIYHLYVTFKSATLLMEILGIGMMELLTYQAIYLHIGAALFYVAGVILLHRKGNKR